MVNLAWKVYDFVYVFHLYELAKRNIFHYHQKYNIFCLLIGCEKKHYFNNSNLSLPTFCFKNSSRVLRCSTTIVLREIYFNSRQIVKENLMPS